MAIPKYNEFFPYFIDFLSDGEIHTLNEVRDYCLSTMDLTEEEKEEKLPSGKNIISDRIGWARTYLKKAGLIESPSRAKFQITDLGLEAYRNGSEKITLSYLNQYESFREFFRTPKKSSTEAESKTEIIDEQISPIENIENSIEILNKNLADDLMTEILKMSPYDFEHLVVELLVKMGYGKLRKDSVTKKSGDEGIDGIVSADRLGFESIYVQAKKWQPDSVVGRPDVQKFVGALVGQGAMKGVFITSARFSKEATEFAGKQLHQKVVLIDGEELTRLLIEYNIGVSEYQVYKVKKLDSDYFNGE
ncbi:MAG: restriction endonuclease [Gemella sp.]|nr:restriction endonuclease [Gemella sp.]